MAIDVLQPYQVAMFYTLYLGVLEDTPQISCQLHVQLGVFWSTFSVNFLLRKYI